MKFKVTFTDNGIAVADNEALNTALDLWKKGKNCYVSNECVILAFRILVKRGIIPHDQIEFSHEFETYTVDEKGKIKEKYVNNFLDTYVTLLSELI